MPDSPCGAPEQWRRAPDVSLHSRRWDDGLVVYRADSGDTFYFEPVALAILDRLAAGPATVDDLCAVAGDKTYEGEPRDLLTRLEQAGLVTRDQAC